MHFNFHLSGDESPEQSRRIANAVLALGGLLAPSKSVGEITVDLKLDTSQAVEAIRDLATSGLTDDQLAALVKSPIFLDPSELPPPVDNDHVAPGCELFEGTLTSDEIRAVESLPPTPPIPTTFATPSGLDVKGLPWDERIHSSNRKINADGTWRYRKNVPDETKRDVEAELRGLVQAPQLTEADLPPAAPTVPVPPLAPAERAAYNEALNEAAAHGQLPPPVPVPTGALQRTYSDVVNLIMARKVQPDTYVAILGMSLPEFAKHVISAPNDATLMFDALDAASRSS